MSDSRGFATASARRATGRGYTPVDAVSFGPDREPRRVWRGWRPRRGWPGGRAWLVVVAAATALAVGAVVLVIASEPQRPAVSARLLLARPLLLAGSRRRCGPVPRW
jgi:hypothetical protein